MTNDNPASEIVPRRLHVFTAADLLASPPSPRRDTSRWRDRARDLRDPPGPSARNRVLKRRNRRVRWPRILWRSRQWAVTIYGLVARDGRYGIDRNNLWQDEGRWGWIAHMAGKCWVDLDDFAKALRVARRMHAPNHPLAIHGSDDPR